LKKANTYIRKDPNDEDMMHLHDVLSQYYRQQTNAGLTLLHLDSMLYHKAIIEKEIDNRLKIQAEFNFEHEKRLAREQFLQAETKRQRVTRNLIILILFLLMGLGILFYMRQRMKERYVQQALREEKRTATEELAYARVQLDDFTRSFTEKNILIEQFTEEIQKLQALPSHTITQEQMETFSQLRASAILTDADWEEFRNRFEKVHTGFLQRLRMRLPDLSPAETRFMALAKLQLNNKEMASILGISPDSIRTIRYRLRKKLNLAEDGDMEELVNSV
jgi:DNA-binding CsgD family transcriptional regulator